MGIAEEIAKVAYELYEKRGKSHGCDIEDWLEAEKIVRERHAGRAGATAKLSRSAASVATRKSDKRERAKPAGTASRKKASGKKTTTERTGR